jgi:hypothetical protein
LETTEKKYLVDCTYKKIADDLLNKQYSVGTRLEPIRVLAKRYNVSYMTAQKAIKALQIQGALEARPGDGIYVAGSVKPLEGSVSIFLDSKGDSLKSPAARRNGNYSIAVIMPFWVSERGEAHIYRMIKGILSGSDPHQWSVELIHNSGDLSNHESNHPDFIDKIESRSPDGIIWLQPILSHRMNLMRLVDRGHKVVVTGRDFPDIPLTCIQMDLDDLAKKSIDCLLRRGSKNIAFITGPVEGMFQDPHSVDIVSAMKNEMQKRGVVFSSDLICQVAFTPYDAMIVHSFIENHPDVDGIVCLHESHIIEELEKMDCTGFFNKSINMVNTSGIYYSGHYESLKHFNMINVAWPLENIGRAVVREFEKSWLEDFNDSPIDLSVDILE